MKRILIAFYFFTFADTCYGQSYNKEMHCGTDTIHVDTYSRKTGERIIFDAFECTQVSKLGIRLDIGFNTYSYNSKTKLWLGNHNGPIFGLIIVYKNFNLGFNFKPATIYSKSQMIFGGDTLRYNTQLNPIKIQCDLSYSLDFKYNFSIDPYIGFTRNSFHVVDEKEKNNTYSIPKSFGFTAGVTINKYLKLKEFNFVSLFVKFGYGLTDFKRTDKLLGIGYTDLAVGLSYKAFYKRKFRKRII